MALSSPRLLAVLLLAYAATTAEGYVTTAPEPTLVEPSSGLVVDTGFEEASGEEPTPSPTPEPLPEEPPKYPPATLDDVRVAEAKAGMADSKVKHLLTERDELWKVSRGNLAIATNPPIRSSSVFALLAEETDKFKNVEDAINRAKAEAEHYRRIAELAGGAQDATEGAKLKEIRVVHAQKALEDAITAAKKMREKETEMLRELQIEKAREF